jgi:hypothetical protein
VLVQRAIEKRKVPTVSITVALDITLQVKPPRAVFVPFMMGHLFGVPFHAKLQRELILSALSLIQTAEASGEVFFFPKTWAEARREGKKLNVYNG